MNLILFDDHLRGNLLPLVYTKPICDLRIGISRISEKWNSLLDTNSSPLTQNYLSTKFITNYKNDQTYWNARFLPVFGIKSLISNLEMNQGYLYNDTILCFRTTDQVDLNKLHVANLPDINFKLYTEQSISEIRNTWDIFVLNGETITNDLQSSFEYKKIRTNTSKDSQVFGSDLYLSKTAKVRGAILNTETGPIYLGPNTEVMEGSVIRGPFALCEGGVVKMQSKIYGATTVGPYSKVGGEINNSVIQGYSNKGHDGFLGNSVIGEWCNLGADTNNSNLKNNYGNVKVWNYLKKGYVDSTRQFVGLIMGDHSKSGINTMFNTGTVVGVSASIFGGGFPDKFIPSYLWGGVDGSTEFDFDKSIEVARNVMSRRGVELTDVDIHVLQHIFVETKQFRV